jgi:hypothetical protein
MFWLWFSGYCFAFFLLLTSCSGWTEKERERGHTDVWAMYIASVIVSVFFGMLSWIVVIVYAFSAALDDGEGGCSYCEGKD